MNFGGNDLTALSELFETQQTQEVKPTITPATMVNAPNLKDFIDKPIGQIIPEDPKAIWKDDEIPDEDDAEDFNDKRPRPKHEIRYKQDVMTEDVFLGLGDKDPSTCHCDALVIRVIFPGHSMDEIDVDVKERKFVAESSKYKLSTYLPHSVDYKNGKAKWDARSDTLVVSVPILREDW